MWGFTLKMSERHLAMFLASGAVITYLGFTAMQEGQGLPHVHFSAQPEPLLSLQSPNVSQKKSSR